MSDNKMRVDRWLWAVRIFKSRTKATNACKRGNVKSEGGKLKPSSLISPGDIVYLHKDNFNLSYKIVKLIPKRVSATLAEPCYINLTPEEELHKFKDWFIGKAPAERREKGAGRPTKRERRDLEQYKDEIYLDDWFDN